MRLSEIITIYLAAGAPFGVHHYSQHKQTGRGRAKTLLQAACAALVWPFVATTLLAQTARAAGTQINTNAEANEGLQENQKIQARERSLRASLYQIDELGRALLRNAEFVELEHTTRAARASVESYVGLSLATTNADNNDSPSVREMEICRLAGRSGDDLLLAGRCIHRRNAARLAAHRLRARAELLHALADIYEQCGHAASDSITNAGAAHRMSVEIVRFYNHAIDLFSLLEDQSAATIVSRLLDAECARLHDLENVVTKQTGSSAQAGVGCGPTCPRRSAFTGGSSNRTALT